MRSAGPDAGKSADLGTSSTVGKGVPELPRISLPVGGGAIRGIDEKLTTGQATGVAALAVTIPTSPARQGFGPTLQLSYDSGAGNGPFGLGWKLPVTAITRKTSPALPCYQDADDSDVFILSGVEDLIPLLKESASGWTPDTFTVQTGAASYTVRSYRPRVEASFSRIERWTDSATGDAHWRTITRDNMTSLYGRSAESRIADPKDLSKVYNWLLDLSYDDRGNAIWFRYKAENAASVPAALHEADRSISANRYLKRIFYGNETPFLPVCGRDLPDLPGQWRFQVVLDYGEHDQHTPRPSEDTDWSCRADPFSSYRAGFEIRTYRLCRRVLMFHDFDELGAKPLPVRSTDLSYEAGSAGATAGDLPAYSFLTSVTQTGWAADPAGGGYLTAALPPLDLSYSALTIDDTCQSAGPDSIENLPGGFGPAGQKWIDLDGEGLQGVLTDDERAWYYKRNLSAWNPAGGRAVTRFAPLREVAEKPSRPVRSEPLRLTDLNGDGHLAAVSLAPPVAGWFERTSAEGWVPFRPFQQAVSIDWSSPDLRLVDLTGDGLADVLFTDDHGYTWYPWIPGTGFGAPRTNKWHFDEDAGPALVLADGTGSIYLADMSGDGLSDLVRIRNGEVCYWPNLGYGRFGAKVSMDGAPVFDTPDGFDQRQVRLADLDGSGTADLVYVGRGTVTIWFNQSGNSWTSGRQLEQLPEGTARTTLSAFDLLGTGTACLVWTSPLPGDEAAPLRYIDLTGGVKPYLLSGTDNNLGATATLTYAPSTKFYLQDLLSGEPWATRLPFPVHVVEQVQLNEGVSRTTVVRTYSYHHGYYDGVEREFRGFGRVDQLDADSLPAQSGSGTFTSPPAGGPEFALPPVRTRTWYHTGAWFAAEDIGSRLAAEYYHLDPQAAHLGRTLLPAGASPEELREACRALRGQVLRTEVYAEDAADESIHPYAATEHRYQVVMLQPTSRAQANPAREPRGLSYAAFRWHEIEALSCAYERDPADPRVSHQLSLEVDDYGSVTKQATVGYPRRAPLFAQQSSPLITYQEHDFINVDGQASWYRLGLPVETRGYELTGIVPSPGTALFEPGSLLAAASAAAEVPYERQPAPAGPRKRLYNRTRIYYRRKDLSGPLAKGQVEPLAVVDASYQLMYTPGLLTQVFGPKIPFADVTALLTGSGGLVDLDGDGSLWAPTARAFYSPDPAHPDPAYASAHFYLPQGETDPWGNISRIGYDPHKLLVVEATDAARNLTTALLNYRVLAPWLVTDPNLNRRGIRFDPLGMVTASAALGKLLPDGSDEGDHLDLNTDEPSAADDPSEKYDYHLDAYRTWAHDPSRDPLRPQPAWSHVATRVRHRDPLSPWLQRFFYSDGFGRAALTKVQAEPGPAPVRDASGRLVKGQDGTLQWQPSDTRWVGTGRIVYDNKANPVKAYEPFFDSTPAYTDESELVEWGVTSITRYDPLSRAIRTDNPDGSYSSVQLGSWQRVSADEDDTVLSSSWYAARESGQLGADQADAAVKAAAASATPAVAAFDPLGRVFRTVADNGPGGQYAIVTDLDISGIVRAVTDPLGRAALRIDHSLNGDELHRRNIDAGERWMALDCSGRQLELWDSRGMQCSRSYDMLRRPVSVSVADGVGGPRLAEEISYGEGLPDGQARNLCGALYQHRDGAGIATTAQRDYMGNVISASRQLLQGFASEVDWSQAPPLDNEVLTTGTTYDALNRPITITTPDGTITSQVFNARSLLTQVSAILAGSAAATSFVVDVTYDPKGQRQAISYGNGAATSYTYDPDTFRLVRLETTRPAGDSIQDLTYSYDPTGNVTRVADAARPRTYFANQVVSAASDYTYDAIYRLTRATGREHIGQADRPQTDWNDAARVSVPLPSDGQAMRNYVETYSYDPVGNLGTVVHIAANGNWTRTYAYAGSAAPPVSNQMTATSVGPATGIYTYDANGNMLTMPQLGLMSWDWQNHLQATALRPQPVGAEQVTYYRYDTAGVRARKVTAGTTGSAVRDRIYLGGYERYREYSPAGNVTLERHSLRVSDGTKLICLVERATVDNSAAQGVPQTVSRYQFDNLLGSAVLELDPAAAILTYEEYYPYGSTSFQSGRSAAEVSLKRYRYVGKERDTDDSGLYYHGARYYAPWLGRWTSCDPLGLVDGTDPYVYARNRPSCARDKSGYETEPPEYDPSSMGPILGTVPAEPEAKPQKILLNRARGDARQNQLADLFRAKGHDVRMEITVRGGPGGSRIDIITDKATRTIESKSIDLAPGGSYRTETGALDIGALRSKILADVAQTQKHEQALKLGRKPDLPFREALVYQLDNATLDEAREFERLFSQTVTPQGIKGGVIKPPGSPPPVRPAQTAVTKGFRAGEAGFISLDLAADLGRVAINGLDAALFIAPIATQQTPEGSVGAAFEGLIALGAIRFLFAQPVIGATVAVGAGGAVAAGHLVSGYERILNRAVRNIDPRETHEF